MNEFVRSASMPTNGRGPAMESRAGSDPPARPVAAALVTASQEHLMLEEAVRELLDRLEGGGVLASEPPPPPQTKEVAPDGLAIGAGEACPLATEIANLGRASVRLRIVVGRALRRLQV